MIKLANLIIQQAVRDGLEKAAKGITTFERRIVICYAVAAVLDPNYIKGSH